MTFDALRKLKLKFAYALEHKIYPALETTEMAAVVADIHKLDEHFAHKPATVAAPAEAPKPVTGKSKA